LEAGTTIARNLDLDATLQAVVEAAARLTRASYCALGVLGPIAASRVSSRQD
jgi:hypothetical protein